MSGLVFFDTNVLIYADDASSPEKQSRAIALFAQHVRRGTAVLSLQVLQEYFAAATRKLGLTPEAAQRKVEIIARGKVVRFEARRDRGDRTPSPDKDLVLGFLIVHAARTAGADTLYSEDFQNGASLGGVRIVNPFDS